MQLQDLTTEHIPAMLELGRAMSAESPYRDYPLNEERTQFILREILGEPSVFAKGAFHQGELVGLLIGEVSSHMFIDVLLASDLVVYVKPSGRGTFAAKQLTDAFASWAEEQGAHFSKIEVSAGINNERAEALFELCGYENGGSLMLRAN